MLSQRQPPPEFFDLSSGFAGELLQRCSTYRVRVAVVGDHETGRSSSFQQFARESNRGRDFVFIGSVEEALARLGS